MGLCASKSPVNPAAGKEKENLTWTHEIPQSAKKRGIVLSAVGETTFRSHLVHEDRTGRGITDFYDIDEGKPLGSGMTCTVRKIKHKKTKKEFALKAIRITRMRSDKIQELRNEIEIMKSMDHPNIVKYYGLCVRPPHICLIFEFCDNGT